MIFNKINLDEEILLSNHIKELKKRNGKNINVLTLDGFNVNYVKLINPHVNILYSKPSNFFEIALYYLMCPDDESYINNSKELLYDVILNNIADMWGYEGEIVKNYSPEDEKNLKKSDEAILSRRNSALIDCFIESTKNLEEKYLLPIICNLIKSIDENNNFDENKNSCNRKRNKPYWVNDKIFENIKLDYKNEKNEVGFGVMLDVPFEKIVNGIEDLNLTFIPNDSTEGREKMINLYEKITKSDVNAVGIKQDLELTSEINTIDIIPSKNIIYKYRKSFNFTLKSFLSKLKKYNVKNFELCDGDSLIFIEK